jgi:putative DNA primase/helicase
MVARPHVFGNNSGPSEFDSFDNPHRLASTFRKHRGGAVRYWRGDFYLWADGAYKLWPIGEVRAALNNFCRDSFVSHAKLIANAERPNPGKQITTRPVTMKLVNDVLAALQGLAILDSEREPPCWIDQEPMSDPRYLVALRNGVYDLDQGRLYKPSPNYFTLGASPVSYSAKAPYPKQWEKFLKGCWPNDPESIAALQEWFAYFLSGSTSQQKALFIFGPTRSGKSLVQRVLASIVGKAATGSPTIASLGSRFGLYELLGKRLAIVPDFHCEVGQHETQTLQNLKSIIGEDAIPVEGKNRPEQYVKLGVRFFLTSNEMLKLNDQAGALVARLFLLEHKESFIDRMDDGLFETLVAEREGILKWSLEGWRPLRDRGRFVEPASAQAIRLRQARTLNPVKAFLDERCVRSTSEKVSCEALYNAWQEWCELHSLPEMRWPSQRLGQALSGHFERTRLRDGDNRTYFYIGIGLKACSDLPAS